MAQRLENTDIMSRHARTKYEWAEWMDGSVWQIKQGEDYTCSTVSMKGHIYSHAFKNNVKVRVRQTDDQTLAFQFFTPEED